MLDKLTTKNPLPPIEPHIDRSAAAAGTERLQGADGGAAVVKKLAKRFTPSSKQHQSATVLGATINRLQQDSEQLQLFTNAVRKHQGGDGAPRLTIIKNIKEAQKYHPSTKRAMVTARQHIRDRHLVLAGWLWCWYVLAGCGIGGVTIGSLVDECSF